MERRKALTLDDIKTLDIVEVDLGEDSPPVYLKQISTEAGLRLRKLAQDQETKQQLGEDTDTAVFENEMVSVLSEAMSDENGNSYFETSSEFARHVPAAMFKILSRYVLDLLGTASNQMSDSESVEEGEEESVSPLEPTLVEGLPIGLPSVLESGT